ncbi:MAG: glycoside hydrolase family 130 protein [Phycisphaeraceae bacterium]
MTHGDGQAIARQVRTAPRVRPIRRPETLFTSDDRRVITRFFTVGGEERFRAVIERVIELDDDQVERLLSRVLESFDDRHRHLERTLEIHYHHVRRLVPEPDELSRNKRLLIGAYFTMEYSIESAALFNPSMVLHPDQSGLDEGQARVLMSLRATGEGHISSIVFRTGTIQPSGQIAFDPPSRFAAPLRVRTDADYEKRLFTLKLQEIGAADDSARAILDELPEFFTFEELDDKIAEFEKRWDGEFEVLEEMADTLLWLARSNYHLAVPEGTDPSEVVIFPSSENESKGIEDVRLTRFVEDDGSVCYYGTYTAYNGFRMLPQLLKTRDFTRIAIHTLNGRYVQNKGMALFPRKIGGLYHMISRLDGENMYLMKSDNVYFWNHAQRLQTPRYPWEFVQIGNCGPPIETEAGWILLTHGVGPMRQYSIGVSLLDLDNPEKVIGHLDEPLIMPDEKERDGYVPNVVYSCGALIHQGMLVIPYAISDRATTFAEVDLDNLLEALLSNGGLVAK